MNVTSCRIFSMACHIHRSQNPQAPKEADQRGHVPADQVVGLGVADGPDQAVVADLQ
jgi:hypothetical protein